MSSRTFLSTGPWTTRGLPLPSFTIVRQRGHILVLPEAGAGHIREGTWKWVKNNFRKHICRGAKKFHELRSRVAVVQDPLAAARRHSSHEGLLIRLFVCGCALRAVQEHVEFVRMLGP